MFEQTQLEAASFLLAYPRDRGYRWETTSERVYILHQPDFGYQVRRLRDRRMLAFDRVQGDALALAEGKLTDLARVEDGVSVSRLPSLAMA